MFKAQGNVLNHIQDEVSQKVYNGRISYNNGDIAGLQTMISTVQNGTEMMRFMDFYNKNLYIFGAGILGRAFFRVWKMKYSFIAFIDNDVNKQGTVVDGLPVISLNEAINSADNIAVVIVCKMSNDKIEEQLKKTGIMEQHIFNVSKYNIELSKRQYFDLDHINKNQKERFVDCGALDGDTSMNMYRWFGGNIDRIWMFEPDKQSIKKCIENFKNLNFDRYEIIEKAVYSVKTQLCFESRGDAGSCIRQDGKDKVDTISLDEAIGKYHPSFIKMDIEGAELEALKGAKGIICRDKPKIAVCVYHNKEDIFLIPKLLLEYNSDYKFWFRHYSLNNEETVIYAL